jgi:hypothetical protein
MKAATDGILWTDTGTAYWVGSEVLTAASMMKTAVFWVVAPCNLVEVYQCF